MPPKLVLTYFDVPGAAEPARWALALSGLEWEDRRLSREEFGVLKPSLPNGQVPVLEIDDYVLPHSMAILRYIGKLSGLYPSDDFEAAKCDAVLYCAIDLYVNFRPALVEQDEVKKRELFEDLAVSFFPAWLANVEKKLAVSGGIYFYDKMSVADILIANRLNKLRNGHFVGVPATIVDPYPNLIALHDSIVEEPRIAAFIAKHAN